MNLSYTTIIISLLAVLSGYIANAIQSGSLFGVATVPKAWLPYLSLVGSFLSAFVASIAGASPVTQAAWFTALLAGLTALGGLGIGVTAHQHLTTSTSLPIPGELLTTDPPPPVRRAPPIVAGMLGVMLLVMVAGCSWLKSNGPAVAGDLGSIAACVISHVETDPDPTYEGIAGECAGAAVTDVVAIVGSLLTPVDAGASAAAPSTKARMVHHKSAALTGERGWL